MIHYPGHRIVCPALMTPHMSPEELSRRFTSAHLQYDAREHRDTRPWYARLWSAMQRIFD